MKRELPVVLTPSRTQTAARCRRRHLLEHICLQRPRHEPEASVLLFGDAIHQGVAAWWSNSADPQDTLAKALAEAPSLGQADKDYHTPELAHALLDFYCEEATLGPDDDEFRIVTVEDRQEISIGLGTLSMMQDRVVERVSTGEIYLMDLKTARRVDQRWRDRWTRSIQMKLYVAGTRLLHGRCDGVYMEGLQKDSPFQLEILEVPEWTQSEIDEAVMLWHKHITRDEAFLIGTKGYRPEALIEAAACTPDSNPGDCYSFYRPCDYIEVCSSPPEERLPLLLGDFHVVEAKY